MACIVADTSALVSLGVVVEDESASLSRLTNHHGLVVPERVIDELEETAAYEDHSGAAAQAVLARRSELDVRASTLDETFPLDNGENAAVTLANQIHATQFLCDEFNQLALIHASLADTRLLTTPILLVTLVRGGTLAPEAAIELLERMSEARSWDENTYVERARSTLQHELGE